jgi:GNAT superfamily N-acetyltransferase
VEPRLGDAESYSAFRIEKLTKEHQLDEFDCGKPSLNDWLRRYALVSQQSDSARTYVLQLDRMVVGYYSLTAGSVLREESPPRVSKGLANRPIGVIVIARLALDRAHQAKGLGKSLLLDALWRCLGASESIGARAVLVHALDDEAAQFYEKFGFVRSPLDPRQLMLMMKDLRATAAAQFK